MKSFVVYRITVLVLLKSVHWVECGPYDHLISRTNIFYMKPAWKSNNGAASEIQMSDLSFRRDLKSIKVLVHGYLASKNHVAMAPVKNAYLSRGYDNIFMADWADASSLDYITSRSFIKSVGLRLAKLLSSFMRMQNIKPEDVHVIGHSLGAHISGEIGRYFNGTLGRVTGLDPALPMFTPKSPDGLQPDAARFVDVIHTDAPVFGDFTPRGHIDFYPNYGITPQPGCNAVDLITLTSCSHYRAPILFAESIGLPENFPSYKCTLQDIHRANVEKCVQKAKNKRSSDTVMMGDNVSRSARGYYFVETNSVPPYGLGANSKMFKFNSI